MTKDNIGLHMGQIQPIQLPPPIGSPAGTPGRLTYRIHLPFRKAHKEGLDKDRDWYELVAVPFLEGEMDPTWALYRHLEAQGLLESFGNSNEQVWHRLKLTAQQRQAGTSGRGYRKGLMLKPTAASDLQKALGWARYDKAAASHYTLHSLRAGGCMVLLLVLNGDREKVKLLGDWKTDEAMANYDRRKSLQLTQQVSSALLTSGLDEHSAATAVPVSGDMVRPTASSAAGASAASSAAAPPLQQSSSSAPVAAGGVPSSAVRVAGLKLRLFSSSADKRE